MGIFDLFKSKKEKILQYKDLEDWEIMPDDVHIVDLSDYDNFIWMESDIGRLKFPEERLGLRRILGESTDIIMQSRKIDIILNRYQLIQDYFFGSDSIPGLPAYVLEKKIIKDFLKKLDEWIVVPLSDAFYEWNIEIDKISNMKSSKARGRNLLKLILRYKESFEKNANNILLFKINNSLVDDLKDMDSIKKFLDEKSIREIEECGIELPDWWNR